MKRSGWIVIGVVALIGAVAFYMLRGGGEAIAIDLVGTLEGAKKNPRAESLTVVDATLAGQTKHSIQAQEPSRVTWSVTVPEKAWLKVSLGLLEQGWTMNGDGVLFRIGVSTGGRYDELLSLMVNPFGNPADRGWHEVPLDLSEYAGERVDIIFNTNSSLPGSGDNRNGDYAVWGAPRIVVQ